MRLPCTPCGAPAVREQPAPRKACTRVAPRAVRTSLTLEGAASAIFCRAGSPCAAAAASKEQSLMLSMHRRMSLTSGALPLPSAMAPADRAVVDRGPHGSTAAGAPRAMVYSMSKVEARRRRRPATTLVADVMSTSPADTPARVATPALKAFCAARHTLPPTARWGCLNAPGRGRRSVTIIPRVAAPDKPGAEGSDAAVEVVDAVEGLTPLAAGVLPGGPEEEGGWPRRYTIVLLCFMAFFLCNMDRVNMSIAIIPMAEEYGWSNATKGIVQSSFFWGYIMTQVAGGFCADKFGGKRVLSFGVAWWSIATILTPVAAQAGLPTLLAARAAMGFGEGVAMPAMNNVLSRWVPAEERSRSLALVYSGMFLGNVVGLLVSPYVINELGWPAVFVSFGSLGAVWFVAAQLQMSSSPADDDKISEDERALVMATSAAGDAGLAGNIPWKKIFSTPSVWAIITCHFCHNWGTFILLTWMPTYYNEVLGLDLFESGFASVLPWATMAVSANAAGWFADTQLIGKGRSVTSTRKIMQTVGFMGPAVCLTILPTVASPAQAIGLLMVSQGCDAFSHSGLYSNHQDIGPRYAGLLLGLSNTAGVLAGVLGTYATGRILESGGWGDVWGTAVGLYLLGTFIWLTFSSGEKQIA